ncbi:cell division inhibitor SulA [Celerinatantimonas sp. YJH-8]|uniref:cell division inhibitor SulA n=1 Tax=Celerinatantimonas sp. YJH-8 TaxID=3228714 RepID=UPI0038C0291D
MSQSLVFTKKRTFVWQRENWELFKEKSFQNTLAPKSEPSDLIHCISNDQVKEEQLQYIIPILRQLSQQKRWVMLIAPPSIPQALSIENYGINTDYVLVVHPHSNLNPFEILERALRSGSCSAVLGWTEQVDEHHMDLLKIAAQQGNTLGFVFSDPSSDSIAAASPSRKITAGYIH